MKKGFRNLPIRRKIVAVTAVASVVALLITGLAALVYEVTSFRAEVIAELQAKVEILRPPLTSSMSFFDIDSAREDLQSLRAEPEIRAAAAYENDGTLFAHWTREPSSDFRFPSNIASEGHLLRGGLLDMWVPISDENERIGYLYIQQELPPWYARLPQYGLMLAAVLLALTIASGLLFVTLERTISGPILELSRLAKTVGQQQDYGVRATRVGNDEIGQLNKAFNEMLTTIQHRNARLRKASEEQVGLQEKLNQANKMESIGRLAGGVAHDFNNFLTVIAGSIEMLAADLEPNSGMQPVINNTRKATDQATDLTRQLLAFARRQVIEPRRLDPNTLALETRPILRSLIPETIDLTVSPSPTPWMVRVDPNQMTQVLMNLATNARDAMPDGGRLTIEIRNTEIMDDQASPLMFAGEYVVISVIDNGEGMTESTRERLFEPFFTTKAQGKGTGLGLATTYGIVKQSGGYIWADSRPGKGTTFKVYLRRSYGEGEAPPVEASYSERAVGHETVLVVEDSDLVRTTTAQLLRSRGYYVLEAADGPEALDLVSAYQGGIDLLLTDMVMPLMSGPDLAERLQARWSGVKVLFVSGYAADTLGATDLAEGTDFLEKPFTSARLAQRVRSVLDG